MFCRCHLQNTSTCLPKKSTVIANGFCEAIPDCRNLNAGRDKIASLGWGWVGGLLATGVMDFILMGALSALGLPAFTCFFIVGDTVARFFSVLGMEMAGGIPLGVATHYLVGPMIGATFGIASVKVGALRAATLKKHIVYGVLYVEIIAQPILTATPLLLKMTAEETLLWFGGSFVMHLIYGVLLGVIVRFGLGFAKEP